MAFCLTRCLIRKNRVYIVMILFVSMILGTVWGEKCFGSGIENLHSIIIVCVAFGVTMCLNGNVVLSQNNLKNLLRIIVVIGLGASFYAMIFQNQYFVQLLRQNNVSWNSWLYVSFFRQRNIFAGYCFISTVAVSYLYLKEKKNKYLLSLLLFGFQIFLTNSRASLLAFVMYVGLCIYLTRRNKIIFVIVSVICVAATLYALDLWSVLLVKFSHTTSSGVDSGEIRLAMWGECLRYLLDKNALLFGFGLGASDAFFTSHFGVGSSHNAYIDALFNGGVVYVVVIIWSLVSTFKAITKNQYDHDFKVVWQSALITYSVYCFFEAGMALFASNYFSVTMTILLLMLSRFYTGSHLILNKTKKG